MQGEGGELAAAAVKVDVAQREQRARARASVRVATWNVRSLRSREAKDELADFVTRRNLGILALQETWRSASARALRVPGYQVFECPTTQDESAGLGVALLVARELPAALVRESPHALWVRVELVCADTPVFVACVYCPRGRARALLEQILLPVLRAAKAAAWATRPERQRDALYLLLGGECGPHRATSLRLLARSGPEAGRVGAVAAERAEERRRGGAAGARALPAPVPVHAPAPVPVPAPHPAAGREARQGFWLVGLARFLQQVLPVRQDLLPPRSQGRVRAMAGLGAHVGVQRAGARAGRRA